MDENLQKSEVSIIPAETTPAKGQFPKKKLKAILPAAIIILCAVAAIIINANRPINRFDHALKTGEYDTALAIYKQNNSDERFVAKTIEKVSSLLSSSLRKYADGSTPYEEMNALLNNTSDYKGVENRLEIVSQVKQIQASKESYEQAEANVENKAYLTALGNYAKVIEEDTENYSSAQKAIASTTELLCSDAIEQATSFMNQEDAVNAYEALSAVGDYKNDAVSQMLTEVTEKAQEQIIGQTQELSEAGDYKGAYLLLGEQPDSLKNEKIKAIEANTLNDLFAQADAEVASGNYDGAISLLTANSGKGLNSDCDAKIKEIKHTENVNILASMKDSVSIAYDKIAKSYSIKNRGVNYIGGNRNIAAVVIHDNDGTTFGMRIGFANKDWIFTDKIIIDGSGKQITLNVDYTNRQTEIRRGQISETMTFMDQAAYAKYKEYWGTNNLVVNLEPVIEIMRNADTVTTRFQGDKGKKDVVIPASHIKQVITIWDIYKILSEDPSLISALT